MSTSTLTANDVITLRGVVQRTFHSSPTFSAGLLRTDDGDFIRFRGRFCATEGDLVALVGRWTKDPKYGRQFDVQRLSYDLPEMHPPPTVLGHVPEGPELETALKVFQAAWGDRATAAPACNQVAVAVDPVHEILEQLLLSFAEVLSQVTGPAVREEVPHRFKSQDM